MPSACLYFLHCCYPWREAHTAWLTTDRLWNWKRDCSPPTYFYIGPERMHESTRVPDHAYFALCSSWRTVVYVCYIYTSWKFHQLAAGQLLSGQPVQYGKGRWCGPSITYKITPAGSLSSSLPGGPPCWASSLAFGLISIGPRLHSLPCNLQDKQRTMRNSKNIEQRCRSTFKFLF